MSKRFNITLACRNLIGDRDEQQDFIDYALVNGELIAVVCDGMGGLKMGSAASAAAAKCLIELFRQKEADENIPSFFLNSIDILDEKVCSLTDENGEPSHAGTTLASICISNGILYWMSVGDSRICILRGDDFEAATRDHNYRLLLNDMLVNGVITQSEYQSELSKAEALVSFIGKGGIDIMDINEGLTLEYGDVILLMSDGLYKNLSNDSIKQCLLNNQSAEAAANRLAELSSEQSHGTSDNVSFILIKTEADSHET